MGKVRSRTWSSLEKMSAGQHPVRRLATFKASRASTITYKFAIRQTATRISQAQ